MDTALCPPDLSALVKGDPCVGTPTGPLARRCVMPPFTVLDGRSRAWQTRKSAWVGLGITSGAGREGGVNFGAGVGGRKSVVKGVSFHISAGTSPDFARKLQVTSQAASIFDPLLCELAYRWWCPAGGQVVDPFAGGSVRGVVAAALGRRYWGCDLRAEQVLANRRNAQEVLGTFAHLEFPGTTPIEAHGPYWVKREDWCCLAGVAGGKVRTCWHLAQGAKGLVTAGSRHSPQVNIVAQIARRLGIPCRAHTPAGELGPEVQAAQQAGAEIVQHRAGYNNVIVARAREDAAARGWTEIPFGMECPQAVEQTRGQVRDLPAGTRRIVVPVGSGMTLAGLLHGLRDQGSTLPVLGVVVGADPTARLDRYAPAGWRTMVELVPSGLPYGCASSGALPDVVLDPIYEAKCVRFLREDDLLWLVGVRQTVAGGMGDAGLTWVCGDSIDTLDGAPPADFVFSCPPYGDLEQYSTDPRDLSNMEWHTFTAAYRRIILRAVRGLKPDRFACFVVGDFRDGRGFYRNFVGETVSAFEECGARLYNEAILATPLGSAALRASATWDAGRKLTKVHQNVLVFCKGDWRAAARACTAK